MATRQQRVLVVLGTRPEAVKQAPVVWALRAMPERFRVSVVNTGQHREMVAPMLPLLDLQPEIDLDLMQSNQTLASLTARCLAAMDRVLVEAEPAAVVVQGDTTTAMAAAMAAFYRRVPVAHVEAGLRSGSLAEPFPEEANRIWIDVSARWLFAPTEGAAALLRRERQAEGAAVYVTGNTVVDALAEVRRRLAAAPAVVPGVAPEVLDPARRVVLVTCHRRESFGEGVRAIARAITRLAHEHPEVGFVYPVHLNPNVRGPIEAALGGIANVHLVAPLAYDAFVRVMEHACLALTDSGGVQEEAPSFGVPVLVLRNRTERPEGVAAGCATLVGTDEDHIVAAADAVLDDASGGVRAARSVNPYGDGHAGERIAAVLAQDLTPERAA